MLAVITQIKNVYGSAATQTIKSVQITEQTYSTQYKLIAEVNGKLAEVVAIKQNNEIKVLGIDLIPSTTTTSTTTTVKDSSASLGGSSQAVAVNSEVGSQLVETIKQSGIDALKNAEVTSITSAESYLNTIYTVTTKNSLNHVQQVTISIPPNQPPQIVTVNTVNQQNTTHISTQSQTTKQVSVITG